MAKKFDVQFKCQHEWGWLLSTWLFLSATGSCLFLLYELFGLPKYFAQLSLGIIVAGGIVLLLELGSPMRAWRGISRLGSSWLSRGALSVGLFVVSGALLIAPSYPAFAGLPWNETSAFGRLLEWLAALCAVMITLYPGIFLSQNRSIPFWHSPGLVLLMVLFAWLGSASVVLLGSATAGANSPVITSLPWMVLLTLVVGAIYVSIKASSGGAAAESVRLLLAGPVKATFWIGVVGVGMVLPVLLLFGKAAPELAGLCLLAGGFLARYCILSVGVYVPSTAVNSGIDFSKLCRTSNALLEREYAGMAAGLAAKRA